MGKATKKHREKVAKRNRRVNQEKYAMNNALNRVMKQMAEMKDKEQTENNLNISVGGQEVPFSVIGEQDLNMEIIEDRVIDHAFKFTPNEEESQKINKEFEEIMGNDEELRETFPLNIEGHNMPLDIDETKEEN